MLAITRRLSHSVRNCLSWKSGLNSWIRHGAKGLVSLGPRLSPDGSLLSSMTVFSLLCSFINERNRKKNLVDAEKALAVSRTCFLSL